jgi:hypothetical protein
VLVDLFMRPFLKNNNPVSELERNDNCYGVPGF